MANNPTGQARGLLLRFMHAELEAARSLYMDNLLEQSAYHILRGWRALARLNILSPDGSMPEDGTPHPGLDDLPLADLIGKEPAGWKESLAAMQELVGQGADPARPPAASQDRGTLRRLRKHIEFQLHLSDQAYQRMFWKERAATSRWPRLIQPKTVGGALALALVALGLGIYFTRAPEATDKDDGKAATSGRSPGAAASNNQPLAPPMPRNIKDQEVTLARVAEVKKAGTHWNAEGNVVFKTVVKVKLPAVSRADTVELSVDNNDVYVLSFHKGRAEVGRVRMEPNKRLSGLRVATVQTPRGALEAGYDLLQLTALFGDSFYSLGHLVLKQAAGKRQGASPAPTDK